MNPSAIRIRSTSASDTTRVGSVLAELLVPGDLVLLDGDLGAGKTILVKGLAIGLGVKEPITSPTFTLLRNYRTGNGITLVHGDLYRLDNDAEVADLALGLDDILADGGIVALEWGGRATFLFDRMAYLVARIDIGFPPGHGGDDDRTVSFSPVGPGWRDRRDRLEAAFTTDSERLVTIPGSHVP